MKTVSGTWHGLEFEGKLVGMMLQCLRIKVSDPCDNLPVGANGILSFHPQDKYVKFTVKESK